MKNNKKGFTLIELLAVIVILAILVMLAIPAVTRYLNTARKNTFADNALRAVEAVRQDIVTASFDKTDALSGAAARDCDGATCTYSLTAIDQLLENKMQQSAFGNSYCKVEIKVEPSGVGSGANVGYKYTMTMVDAGGNGFVNQDVGDINAGVVDADGTHSSECS